MKKILLIIGMFLFTVLSANADVVNLNGSTYATEDCIIVHCIDGQFREFMSLSQNDILYIVRKITDTTMLNGNRYINLTDLSQKLLADGKNMYVVPKTKQDNIGTKVGKVAVREYVYNGSEYEMKHNPTNRCYLQSAIGKTENLIGVFQSSSLSSLDKIRNVIYAFGY